MEIIKLKVRSDTTHDRLFAEYLQKHWEELKQHFVEKIYPKTLMDFNLKFLEEPEIIDEEDDE